MSDFVRKEDGQKLRDIFAKAQTKDGKVDREKNPLYSFKRKKAKGGVTGHYSYKSAVQEAFDLLTKDNGYGVYDSHKEHAAAIHSLSSKSPEWIKEADGVTLNRFIYYFNRQHMTFQDFTAQKISNGTVTAILDRAMELGPFKRQPSTPVSP
ncbi:MAG: hypothetical protein DI626_08675 [Micavibrio aeruginosavorus]|uniref:Uncharacterized protein n=1 Tax=Micavibrio aeruginosavorus TaxID=349221 RepID=A0A2W4ZNN0_9BACT|nr:MAG: hypothetical protein DI626_08675 [Micavibrio aeruginosavorus]